MTAGGAWSPWRSRPPIRRGCWRSLEPGPWRSAAARRWPPALPSPNVGFPRSTRPRTSWIRPRWPSGGPSAEPPADRLGREEVGGGTAEPLRINALVELERFPEAGAVDDPLVGLVVVDRGR